MSTTKVNNSERCGGPTTTSYLAQNDLPSVSKSNSEVRNIMEKQSKASRSKNNKKFLTKAVKFAPKFAPEPQVTIPVISDSRVLLNADSAVTGHPAKILQRVPSTEDKTTEMSKRKMKAQRSKLSKGNFAPLPELKGLQIEPEPKLSEEEQIIQKLIPSAILDVRCYQCNSGCIVYFPCEEKYWYSFNCKIQSCYTDFMWHPLHGTVSKLSFLAIVKAITNTSLEEALIAPKRLQTPKKLIKDKKNNKINPTKLKRIVFDNSGIRLKQAQAAINFVKLPFKDQKKVVGVGLRDVSTVPVYENVSYKQALESNFNSATAQPNPPKFNFSQHKVEYNRIKALFFETSRDLFKKWQDNKIDKKYKNPFFSNTHSILNRFWNEPTHNIKLAYQEWFTCASAFGNGTGKIRNNWSI